MCAVCSCCLVDVVVDILDALAMDEKYGAYADEAATIKAKTTAGAAHMGTSKRRDNFGGKSEADLPGPGNYGEAYSSFSKTQRVPIGGKYKSPTNATPGPGSYAANDPLA